MLPVSPVVALRYGLAFLAVLLAGRHRLPAPRACRWSLLAVRGVVGMVGHPVPAVVGDVRLAQPPNLAPALRRLLPPPVGALAIQLLLVVLDEVAEVVHREPALLARVGSAGAGGPPGRQIFRWARARPVLRTTNC